MTSPSPKAVRYRDVLGRLGEIELTERSEFVSPGSVLEQRLVIANRQLFVCKYVSRAAGARNPRLYDLLDNEIRAGARLGQVFGGRFPPELANLVAYNMDADEPFALLHAYTGEPVSGLAARFDEAQRRHFQIGLLRAVQLIAAAGVVHGAVTGEAVRWNGRQLQLVDFESAERVGDRRRGGPGSPARSPEQVAGMGLVDGRDDLWGAGLLIRGLHLGGLTNGMRMDRRSDPELLRTLLDPVFDNPVERRPHPAALLRMLRADGPLPPLADPEAGLRPGYDIFEQTCMRKRGPQAPDPPTTQFPRPPVNRNRLAIPLLTTMILVAMLIVGVAVLV